MGNEKWRILTAKSTKSLIVGESLSNAFFLSSDLFSIVIQEKIREDKGKEVKQRAMNKRNKGKCESKNRKSGPHVGPDIKSWMDMVLCAR
jgi:hypothetical protein